jgi:hypothetical protein
VPYLLLILLELREVEGIRLDHRRRFPNDVGEHQFGRGHIPRPRLLGQRAGDRHEVFVADSLTERLACRGRGACKRIPWPAGVAFDETPAGVPFRAASGGRHTRW